MTYPNPWKGGTLHLRDAVEYMLTGSLAVLEVAAKYRERFLYGIYQVGARQIAKGQTEAPVAYVVPTPSTMRPASLAFIGTLMKGGIEVHRAARPFAADGISYPAGTHVVLLAQPFRPFAKDLFEPQSYPDLRTHADGPPLPPYDVAGWTLSYQMGVHAVPVARAFDITALVRLDSPPEARAVTSMWRIGPQVWGYVIDPAANVGGNRGQSSPRPGAQDRTGWPPPSAPVRPSRCRPAPGRGRSNAGALSDGCPHVPITPRARAGAASVSGCGRSAAHPRNAWSRYVLAGSASTRAGWRTWTRAGHDGSSSSTSSHTRPSLTATSAPASCGDASTSSSCRTRARAASSGAMRHPCRPAARAPRTRCPPEYQGGIGDEGVEALKRFVDEGGTLVTLDEASDLALERFGGVFGRISNVTRGLDRTVFYCPGSVLRLDVDIERAGGVGNVQRKRRLLPGLAGLRHGGPFRAEHRALRVGRRCADERLAAGGRPYRAPSRGAGRAVRRGARGSLRFSPAVPGAAARDLQAALQRTAELRPAAQLNLRRPGLNIPCPVQKTPRRP